jgi:hypothetical protein
LIQEKMIQEKLDQLLLSLPNRTKRSRGIKIASTILMILSGVMLYTENILEEQLVQKFLSLLSINYDLEYNQLCDKLHIIDMYKQYIVYDNLFMYEVQV